MPIFHELIALSNEVVAAVRDHDTARLEELLAAEFTLNGAAGELDRASFLEAASGAYEIDDWAYEEIDPELYGDTAVIVSRYRQTARLDGRDLSHHMHVTDIWVRRDGRWQIVRRHATIAAG
jgi:ketosteroid isomerase-like protein